MENVAEFCYTTANDQPPSIYFPGQEETWWQSNESSTDEDDDGVLEGFLKELDAKGHEIVMKLVGKVENEVPFEELFGDTWQHAPRMLKKIARKMGREREGDGGLERRERGVDVDSLPKNERFKVKTMNGVGSGVVKEEEGQ